MKVAVVTTSRADYGLLYWPIRRLLDDPFFTTKLIVSGSHLSPHHGTTYKEIQAEGLTIDWNVDMLLSSDTAIGACKSLAMATIGFAESFQSLKPDLILLLGDRFEVFAAAQSAVLMNIPIAHIAGGDVTEGAFDDTFRYCLTKMAHIHFPTNQVSADRIIQVGENPEHVFVVGSPGIDYIVNISRLTRPELERELNFNFLSENILVTFHAETRQKDTLQNFAALLEALDQLGSTTGIIFTLPNIDPGGQAISDMIRNFVEDRPNVIARSNLGSRKYLSLLAEVNCVVGNSSSGLYEAPALQTATVNIGDRQKGRLSASSVIDVPATPGEILAGIRTAIGLDCRNVENPFGDGTASQKIVQTLKRFPEPQSLLRKTFHQPTQLCHTLS